MQFGTGSSARRDSSGRPTILPVPYGIDDKKGMHDMRGDGR